jgi:mono/diheme cytochrome c family protein
MRALMMIAAAMVTARLAGAAEPPTVPVLSAREQAAGKRLYATKCAACHKLHEPSRYDDERWNYWMDKMRLKARLDDNQYAALANYLRALRPPQPRDQAALVDQK